MGRDIRSMPGRLTQSVNIHVWTLPQAPGRLLCTEETDVTAQWAGGHTGGPAWAWGPLQTSWRSEWDESGNSPQGRDGVRAEGTTQGRPCCRGAAEGTSEGQAQCQA